MEINLTLVGQLITFAIVVWFTMHYVWPPLIAKIEERQLTIANGLSAATQAEQALLQAEQDSKLMLDAAKAQAQHVIENANKRAIALIDTAKQDALSEGQRMIVVAKGEIAREIAAAKESLRHQVAAIAVAGAEKILGREMNQAANQQLLDELINQQF